MSIVAADELRLLIERVERLTEEVKNGQADVADVYQEAKARGYDVKTMKAVVKRRAMESQARQEADALLATYCAALGLAYDGPEPAAPRVSKVPTPLEEAIESFEKSTEGVPVTMSVNGGPEVPINKAAREKSLADEVGDTLERVFEGTGAVVHRNVKVGGAKPRNHKISGIARDYASV